MQRTHLAMIAPVVLKIDHPPQHGGTSLQCSDKRQIGDTVVGAIKVATLSGDRVVGGIKHRNWEDTPA